ncbi:uncharacterized protein [Dysidea avara]|uniref:uncharacterized protein n=1 Tax=Dysidea avara TaxID=196820 RepID=UPI00332BEB59
MDEPYILMHSSLEEDSGVNHSKPTEKPQVLPRQLHMQERCSTDVHGELGYPLLEILTAMPIEVKITQSSAVSMNAIYDTVKTVYSTFKLSMVTSSMFLAQDSEENFYEKIRRIDGTYHIYDLERPCRGCFWNCKQNWK